MVAGPWNDRTEFETWWLLNVRALNLLSVTDRQEYERVCRIIEAFNAEHPK